MSERRVSVAYPWLTIEPDDDRYSVDMVGATPAEMDRRVVIMQELAAGRIVLAEKADEPIKDAGSR